MMVKLEIDKLKYNYDRLEVLKEVSFAVEEAGFTGLIGPNGSGKSTLLKNISAILKPDSGYVYLDGRALHSLPPKQLAKKLAVVPQSTDIKYDFTVEEIVLMGRNPYLGRFTGETEHDRKVVKRVMEATNILEYKDRYISQLSGGEKQRVIIARSLAQEPEVLLLDEPTSSLDINYRSEIMNLLQRLNQNQRLSILIVLHDLNLAARYCQDLILLKEGKIYDSGPPGRVITAENIEDVYGSRVIIKHHYPDNRPYVIPVAENGSPAGNPEYRVHLLCGGGTGRGLLEVLAACGYQVSCGVLNRGDSDHETARELGLVTVTDEPFAPITDRAHRENLALIEKADTVVLTAIPFGNGNILNLKAALWAVERGKELIAVNRTPAEDRDYTGGRGQKLFAELLQKDVITVDSYSSVLEYLADNAVKG